MTRLRTITREHAITRRRLVALGLAAVAVLGVSGVAVAAPRSSNVTLAAASAALPGNGSANETATQFDRTHAASVRATATATTSLTCAGCTGRADTLQVVVSRPGARVHAANAAVAWASGCTDCGGWALSLQVVVSRGKASLVAANRALAVNAECTRCTTQALAVQIVVTGATREQLSNRALRQIAALRAQLIAQLVDGHAVAPTTSTPAAKTPAAKASSNTAAGSPDRPTTQVTAEATKLQTLVREDLGASGARAAVVAYGG